MRIDPSAHRDIIEAYTIDLWPCSEIAEILHVSRQTVWKFLKKHGIDTSDHKLDVSCTTCSLVFKRTRKRVRTQLNHFCSSDCYSAFLDAGKTNYNGTRHGQRIARRLVADLFDLHPEHVVHHEDRNTMNNQLSNLKVFACASDHIKYHHINRDRYHNPITSTPNPRREQWLRVNKRSVEPIWDGSLL